MSSNVPEFFWTWSCLASNQFTLYQSQTQCVQDIASTSFEFIYRTFKRSNYIDFQSNILLLQDLLISHSVGSSNSGFRIPCYYYSSAAAWRNFQKFGIFKKNITRNLSYKKFLHLNH